MRFKEELDLCLAKLNGEIEDSWKDIVNKLDLDIHEDTLRRMAYGYRKYDEYLQKFNLNDKNDEELASLTEKILELKEKRIQLSDERTLTNKKIRSLARIEDFIKLFREELDNFPYKDVKDVTTNDTIKKDQEGVLLLSDIHYGLKIDNPVNIYDPALAYTRMDNLVDKVVSYCKLHNISKLDIFELGDTISGHIHNNIRLENRQNVVKQIVGASDLLSCMLHRLCNELEFVVFNMVEGNHDRVLPRKEDNLNEDSFSILIQELIIEKCKNIPNLRIVKNIGLTYSQMEIKGNKCFGVHGDKDKINNVIGGLTNISGQVPDYVFMGHMHNANEYTEGQSEVIMNGCFCGTDEYAYNLRKNSKAIQKFMVFNDTGRICTYNIDVAK